MLGRTDVGVTLLSVHIAYSLALRTRTDETLFKRELNIMHEAAQIIG